MINIGGNIQSNNSNMTTLLRRTWSKVDDGNGPDGVYRSHLISFGSPGTIAMYPIKKSDKMRVQRIEVAFGCTSWSGNTSPRDFAFQYTDDDTASYNDARNDSRWVTAKSYTGWNHKSGIVNIYVDFTCKKMRIYVSSSYQSTYYQSTVFRIYGEIISLKALVQDGEELKTVINDSWSVVGVNPPTKEMFELYGEYLAPATVRKTKTFEEPMGSSETNDSGSLFKKTLSLMNTKAVQINFN